MISINKTDKYRLYPTLQITLQSWFQVSRKEHITVLLSSFAWPPSPSELVSPGPALRKAHFDCGVAAGDAATKDALRILA